MKWLYNKQGGFTLLELVVAIGILGIIMVSILGLFNQAYLADQSSWSKIQLLNAAQTVMEDVISGKASDDYQPPQGYEMQINRWDVTGVVGLKKIQIKIYPENIPQMFVVLTAYTTNDVSYTPPDNGGGQDGQKNGDFYKWLEAHTDVFNTAFIVILVTYLAFNVFWKKVAFDLIIPDFKKAYDNVMDILYNQFYSRNYQSIIKNVDLSREVEKAYNLTGSDWEVVKKIAQFLDELRKKWNAWFS